LKTRDKAAAAAEKINLPMIEYKTLDGTMKNVWIKDLILRPSAYAIIMRDANILLMGLRHTGKYHLPGDDVYIGERIKDTLKLEVKEQTGLDIEVGTYAHFGEFFPFRPLRKIQSRAALLPLRFTRSHRIKLDGLHRQPYLLLILSAARRCA